MFELSLTIMNGPVVKCGELGAEDAISEAILHISSYVT